jgi:hypothetical protein
MAIYRGPGGSGDAVNDSSSETRLAVEARDAAIAAQAAAEAAQAAAETAETNAETAETNAETAETNAETAATNAASSASSASSSASSASSSASAASTSASNASTSASSAATSATNASNSASAASTSATNAANSATAAATSATNASNSASAASTSETNAANSATAAQTAETNAETAETNAETAQAAAELAETNAETAASSASTSASNASTSATNASNSASAAATSATNASNSASAAATSATAAQTAETNAETAQAAAEAARDAALSAYDNFDDRYLGPKSSDPTLDNDGNALLTGALYFNTATNVMKVYDGSTWVAAYVSAAGVLLAVNNLSDLNSVSTARTNLGVTATGSDTTYAYRSNNLSDLASASTARTNLGLGTAATTAATDYATAAQGAKADTALQPAAIGVTVQGYDAQLADVAGLTPTDNNFIVGNGTNFVTESGSTARTSLGLGSIATQDASSVTVTGGSINGTTVGASTASTGAFTTLSASGAFSANGGTTLGDASGDALTINSSAVSIPNGLNFDSNTFVIDATNNRVGVGTASPATPLDVNGLIKTNTGIEIGGTSSYLYEGSANSFNIRVGGDGPYVEFIDAGSSILEFGNAGGALALTSNSTERMRIDSSGNVGIGTSSPVTKTDIAVSAGGSSQTATALTLTNTSDAADNGVRLAWRQNGAAFETAYVTALREGAAARSSIVFATTESAGTWSTTAPSEKMRITSDGTLKFNSGYGSVATAYGCRAWVNFNGTGTVAIRESRNVSSITDGGTGIYTINFTNAMPDANYAIQAIGDRADGVRTATANLSNAVPPTTSSCRLLMFNGTVATDFAYITASVFR